MKAKLIKKDDHYFLWSHDWNPKTKEGFIANTFDKPSGEVLQLSIKNCQAIERGYDLDELAFQSSTLDDVEHSDMYRHLAKKFFKEGFQKALEILGDKRFTDKDLDKAIEHGHESRMPFNEDWYNEFIQSLQQNEWEVLVEVDHVECEGMCEDPDEWDLCSDGCKMTRQVPKFDCDGCLILRRFV